MAKKTKRYADGGTVSTPTGPMYPPTRPGYPNPPTFRGTPGGGYNAMGMGRMPGGSSSRPPRTVQTPSVSYGQAGGNDPYEESGGLGAPAGYNNPSAMGMGRDPNASTGPRMTNPGTSSTGSVGATTRPVNPNPTPVQLLRKGGAVKKSKRMAVGGPVPAASRLPSGKRGDAYKSAVSAKMSDAESRLDGYEAPEFKSARRSEYNANKMERRSGNASDRLSALGAKGYKKGGKVKRMAEGGLPEDAPMTATNTMPSRPAPMPNPHATTRPTPGPRPYMGKEDREEERDERKEERKGRREDRRSNFRDRFEAWKAENGKLGYKGWNQLMQRMPDGFMDKFGDRIGDFMSERFNKAPKLGGELPPTTMKKGGRVKAKSETKRYAKGGMVRGSGCAVRGVKKARMS